jgi:hypothetical protein
MVAQVTTLRIEVARCSGTTIADVLQGLRLAGCMKHIEIDPSEHQFIPYEQLSDALERDGFYVEVRPWPEPPPLPLWRRARALPRRAYLWGRRVFLGETYTEQYLHAVWGNDPSDALHRVSMAESPLLRMRRKP